MLVRSTKPTSVLIVTLVLLGLTQNAAASHYRLEVLPFLEAAHIEAYHAAGLTDTEDFLLRALTPEDRQSLSQQTGISELEILVLARLCELLQITGIGPEAAQLIRASGVVSLEDLASRDPVQLTVQLAAVNAVEQLTGVDPVEENLIDWIEPAREATHHVR